MTLNEYIKQNGSKQIEIQDDGTIKVLEDKGPWKPETGDRYFHIYGNGDFEEDYWFGGAADDYRAEIGNVFRTNAEIKRIVHRLKARKKFLDAGGHEGMDGYEFEDKYHAYPQRCDKPPSAGWGRANDQSKSRPHRCSTALPYWMWQP